jgi:hypothetical protein
MKLKEGDEVCGAPILGDDRESGSDWEYAARPLCSEEIP